MIYSHPSAVKTQTRPKIMIVGLARHGKDTACEILRDYKGYTFISSSMHCAKAFIFDALKEKYGYASPEECYEDRVNHRAEWFDMICEYNSATNDKARLSREIFSYNDLYCGIRDVEELRQARSDKIFDYVLFVDAFERKGQTEGKDSNNITIDDADFVIKNNGTQEEFQKELLKLVSEIEIIHHSIELARKFDPSISS